MPVERLAHNAELAAHSSPTLVSGLLMAAMARRSFDEVVLKAATVAE
jgi:hypothetical protein